MKIKIFNIFTLLIYSTLVLSQTDNQKATFQIFRDSCNQELEKQFQSKDYNSALKTIDVAQKRYDNLDSKIKNELKLEGSLFYARASLYLTKNDIKLSEKYLKKAIQFENKDSGKIYFQYSLYYFSNNNIRLSEKYLNKAYKYGYQDSGKLFINYAGYYANKNNKKLTERYLSRATQNKYKYKDIGKLFNDYAMFYISKNDRKTSEKYLKKAAQYGYKDIGSLYYESAENSLYNKDDKSAIYFLEKATKAGHKGLNSRDTVSLPWHLTDIYTQLKKDICLKKLEIDFSILSDIPDNLCLYIAPLGYGTINNQGYYGGIQTEIQGTGKPGLIFSRWNERDTMAIRTDSTGNKCSSGSEGDFISTRKIYNWSKGKYKISLTVEPDTIILKGKILRWVTMSIYSYNTKQEVINGSLAFPGDTLKLNKDLAVFVEIYGGGHNPVIALKDVPEMEFSFDKFIVNGKEQVQSGIATYWIDYPRYADVTYKDGKINVSVGKDYSQTYKKLKKGRYVERLFEETQRQN